MTTQKPVVHIEVCLRPLTNLSKVPQIQREIVEWLRTDFLYLILKRELDDFTSLPNAVSIASINVVDRSPPGKDEEGSLRVEDVDIALHCYKLHETDHGCDQFLSSEDSEHNEVPVLHVSELPSQVLHKAWDSLYFADGLRASLLHWASRMMKLFSNKKLDLTLLNWNRVMLLHGPPGCGKTTLCRALAQKLAIRGCDKYSSAYLAEVNANALHSKFFGESGKAVAKAFAEVFSLARDEATLVCVLIDEVEIIAGSREHAHASHEVADASRATTQLLTALDKLKQYPNVLVLCTSNFIEAIDAAFLDRVDIDQYVSVPSTMAAYEILRTSLNHLIQEQEILVADPQRTSEDEGSQEAVSPASKNQSCANDFMKSGVFPGYWTAYMEEARLPDGPIAKLMESSRGCIGFSGRVLRRLPCLAIAKYMFSDPVCLSDALAALNQVVHERVKSGEKADD